MTVRIYSEVFRRKRRFLLLAPVGVAILLTVLFESGGGGGAIINNNPVDSINVSVPPAHVKEDKKFNKFSLYEKQHQDSLQAEQARGKTGDSPVTGSQGATDSVTESGAVVEKSARIRAELERIVKNGLPAQAVPGAGPINGVEAGAPPRRAAGNADIDRLERMYRTMKEGESTPGPEMQELNRALDKLMAVRSGGRLADTAGRDRSSAPGAAPLPVQAAALPDVVSGWTKPAAVGNRFYDLESNSGEETPAGTAIEAIIPVTQTLVGGALIRLELATDLVVKGVAIPRGQPLYGLAHLAGERLQVTVTAIRYKDRMFPVDLEVLDQDGLAGIYEPGSINRDALKESAAESAGSVGAVTLDPSLAAQAAGAGIQLARSLVGKKIRLVKVTVPAGYRVFLKDVTKKD